jgi:type IV secretory pathway TrbL component
MTWSSSKHVAYVIHLKKYTVLIYRVVVGRIIILFILMLQFLFLSIFFKLPYLAPNVIGFEAR